MSVKVIKLISGEEIIAESTVSKSHVKVENAIAAIPQPGKTDPQTGMTTMGFAFIPWATLAKAEVLIDLDTVIYIADPEEQLMDHYNKMFGKIQTPPTGLVIAR